MCYYYELDAVTSNENYATFSTMAFLSGEYLSQKQFWIEIKITKNFEDFLKWVVQDVNLKREKDMARATFRSSNFEKVSRILHVTV